VKSELSESGVIFYPFIFGWRIGRRIPTPRFLAKEAARY
jgi:hypothetical protein